jgi:uncharacterized membrane protein YeaQ/YmgE (transglycosylase-associated protein family)
MIENYGIIGWIVIGLLAGGIAKLLMPGKDPGGCLITILLGIAGALLAGFIGKAVGWYDEGEAAGFIAAIVGAFLILLIYRWCCAAAASRSHPFILGPSPLRSACGHGLFSGGDPCVRPVDAAAGAGRCAPSRRAPSAQQTVAPPDAGRHRLDISATGEVTRVPDLAIISAGVQTLQPTATGGDRGKCARMERVRAALKRAGIADKDIQTSRSTSIPNIAMRRTSRRVLTGYQASNTVNVKFRDLKRTGAILDALVAEGANQINGPNLTIDKPEAASTKRAPRRSPMAGRAPSSTPGRWDAVVRLLSVSESGGYAARRRCRW